MKKYIVLSFISLFYFKLSAQLVNIQLQQNATNQRLLEVIITPQGNYTGTGSSYISAVVFTVRWRKDCGASVSLGATTAPATSLPMAKSGSVTSDATYNYQIFSCIGTPQAYTVGTPYLIMTVPVEGVGMTCSFEIIPLYTGPAMEDGNYYIETPALPSNQGNVAGITNYNSVVLPITLVKFNVEIKERTSLIEWLTESEISASHFEIEASMNNAGFTKIGSVKAQGKASHYTYTDLTPKYGIVYYRLKMVDNDNSFQYSKVVSLDFSEQTNNAKVFPNPFSDNLTVELSTKIQTQYSDIHLMDIYGKIVWSQTIKNTEGGIRRVVIPTIGFPAGVYWIKLENKDPLKVVKF